MKKNYILWCLPGAMLLFTLGATAQPANPAQPRGSAQHVAIPLDRTAADRYAGYCQIGPQRAVQFWREGNHFYFGPVGTPQRIEIFPETSTRFFLANLPGTGLVQVTDYTLNANHPVFAPDGRKLVFAIGDPSKKQENIAVVTRFGTNGPSAKR